MEPRIPPEAPIEVRSRERIAIRIREGNVTLSAWRTELAGSRGAMVVVEIGGRSIYRGEGALLGSSQEKLAELWRASLPPSEPEADNPPLG
jgi:hypothetical protein